MPSKLYQRAPQRAEQFTGANNPFERIINADTARLIQTSAGIVSIVAGDWVVEGEDCTWHVVKPDVFAQCYQEYVAVQLLPATEHTTQPVQQLLDWNEDEESLT